MKKNLILIFIGALLLVGCATKTTKIFPKPVQEEQRQEYEKYSCTQISSSLTILEKRAQRIAGMQNDKAKSDAVLISWGWLLYGVPYLFLDGNGPEKEEFETILGQKQALENMFIKKSCSTNNPVEIQISTPERY